tara:strand:- start:1105 stop:2871 length:1767 start_codon:yes stop_codon:yes gene_type:complete
MPKFINKFPFIERTKSLETKIQEILTKRNSLNESLSSGSSDAQATNPKSIQNILKKLKNTVLSVIGGGNRNIFLKPEWDFPKVQLAFTNESILRRATEKYVEQIRKHSWELIGNNPNTVAYVKKRFKQIELVTNKPMAELFDEIAFNLVLYNNCLITKKRNRKASGGNTRKTFDGYTRIPIAGYEILDPTCAEVDRDNYGNIRKWRQKLGSTGTGSSVLNRLQEYEPNTISDTPSWPQYNMIHIRDRGTSPSMYFFAMPMAIPVLADLEALRELEELFLLESIKVAVPKVHAKVGSKDFPGTQDQIDDLASTIQYSTGDGIIVTSDRVEFDEIAKSSNANEILNHSIGYFRERVLAGLGMSDIAMGKSSTSNRATAQVLSSEMQSTSAKFQRIIKRSIEFHVIQELLYESGYSEITLGEDNAVYLSIPEVDLQEKITREAHMLNLYISNSITEDELRKELGRDIIGDTERDTMYISLVQIPLAKAKAEAQAEAAIAKSNSISRPSNQHGTQLTKPKIAKDEYRSIWNKCLAASGSHNDVLNEIQSSILDPYDITIMKVLLNKYLQQDEVDNEEAIKNVFIALEEQITE